MQGIGTPNIITQQTIFHIDLFIRLTASDSLSGQSLQMTHKNYNWRWAQGYQVSHLYLKNMNDLQKNADNMPTRRNVEI